MVKTKLGDIFVIQSGGTPSKRRIDYYENGDIPWIKTGDLKEKYISNNVDCITELGLQNSSAKLFPINTVLVAMYGATIGACSILPFEASTNQACAAFLPNEKVLPEYLYYFLCANKESFIKDGVGGAQPNISAGYLKKVVFKIKTLSDQKKIIDTLDKVKLIINNRKQQLQQLDELVKARFVEMFGDYDLSHTQSDWKPISEIGKVVGGATPKTTVDEYWDGEYRWITPAELQSDSGYIYDSVRKLTKSGVESCSLQEMPIGTVILSSRAPIGKVAIAGNTFYCNQGFKNIICNDNVLPRYLYAILLFNTEYLNSLGRGATFKEISKSIVENIKVPIPSMNLQKEFVAFVEQTDKSKVAVQKALDEAQILFDSLMQEYFG